MRLPAPTVETTHASLQLRLPGGRAGQPYQAVLQAPVGYQIIDVTVPSNSGLVVSGQPLQISGVPRCAGPVALSVTAQTPAGHVSVSVVDIAVSPNPADLWQSKPSDSQAEGAKPDTAFAEDHSRTLLARACSLRGRAHAQKGGHREDDVAIAAFTGTDVDGLVFAVSDGAGSAAFSRIGSAVVAATACTVLRRSLEQSDCASDADARRSALVEAAQQAARALLETASSSLRSIDEYATTLLLAYVLAPRDADLLEIGVWQAGDGLIACSSEHDIVVLGTPDQGEYSGQTRFLHTLQTEAAFTDRATLYTRRAIDWLVAGSDGVFDPFVQSPECGGQSVADSDNWSAIRTMIAASRPQDGADWMASMASAVGIFTPGDHDDRSLVVIGRRSHG